MPDIVLYIFLYLALVVFDVIPLIKKKKSMLVYMPIFLFTLVIDILHGLGVYIPSPTKPIQNMIGLIFGIK